MGLLKKIFTRRENLSQIPKGFSVSDLIKSFDVFYVCFDEPNKKENWQQIKKTIPKANKIEGIVGFDNALKTCAKQAQTKHFFLIDGDNQILPERLKNKLGLNHFKDDWVLSWSSLNTINGLRYGNGGVKLWPKKIALEIKSHENAEKNQDQTDYCFIANYFLIDDFISQTFVNKTPNQAFRAGFREGFKMSLNGGKQESLNWENFEKIIFDQNRERLKIWCEVGGDIENGYWSILGARFGLLFNAVKKIDYTVINSYSWIDEVLNSFIQTELSENFNSKNQMNQNEELIQQIKKMGAEINKHLPIDLKLLSKDESIEFKKTFKNPPRSGLLKP